MKRIVKENYKLILGFIAGLLFAIPGIFAASVISSSNLAYDNTNSVSTKTNVQEAVDDLYDKATVGDATEENILSDKTALVSGTKVTGSMVDNGAISKNLSFGESYTIPAGYHNGQGKVTASSPSGTLNISSNGSYNVTNYASANVNVSASSFNFSPIYISNSKSVSLNSNSHYLVCVTAATSNLSISSGATVKSVSELNGAMLKVATSYSTRVVCYDIQTDSSGVVNFNNVTVGGVAFLLK